MTMTTEENFYYSYLFLLLHSDPLFSSSLNYSNNDKLILPVFTNVQQYLESYWDNTPKINLW